MQFEQFDTSGGARLPSDIVEQAACVATSRVVEEAERFAKETDDMLMIDEEIDVQCNVDSSATLLSLYKKKKKTLRNPLMCIR